MLEESEELVEAIFGSRLCNCKAIQATSSNTLKGGRVAKPACHSASGEDIILTRELGDGTGAH